MLSHWSESTDWIWCPHWDESSEVARIVQFRRTVTLNQVPSQSLIHVSADSRYRLFVNGSSVSFGPAKSYLGEWNFETVNIAPYLKVGKNVIAARVLRYSPRFSGNMSLARAVIPGFILYSAELDISTNSDWLCKPDNAVRFLSQQEWNPALGPSLLNVNEDVDGSKEDNGWLDVAYDDSQWETAVKASMKAPMVPIVEPRRLVERSIPPLPEIHGRFSSIVKTNEANQQIPDWNDLVQHGKPVTIPNDSQITIVLDATELTTAFLQLRVRGGAGTKIRIRCAECFEEPPDSENPNPFARKKGDRTDTSGVPMGPDDFYKVSDSASANAESYYEPFWFRTFRYIELDFQTASEPLQILQLDYRATHYPLDVTTQFSTFPSVEASKQWNISLNTLHNCMHETYEDCPFYEQNQFAMDARLQVLFTYQLSHDDRLARKCMQEFYSSRRADGLIETHFPAPCPVVNIPYFSLYWILMVHDHMMYVGDRKLVRRYLGTIDGILDHFDQRVADNGLVGRLERDVWPFVDWTREWSSTAGGDFRNLAVPPAYHRTGFTTYSSLIYAYALRKAAELCEFIGRHDTASEYEQRATELNEAVRSHCLRREFLVDGPDSPEEERSQHSQVFAILSGALEGEQARDVLLRALTDPSYVRCSYAMSFYVFEAARKTGLYDELRSQLLEPWSSMIRQNLTTWAESAAMPRSDCHGWSAVPIHDFVANVVGLSPAAPGYQIIRFEPRRKIWQTMAGTFAVGSGNVKVSWAPGLPVEFVSDFDGRLEVHGKDGQERVLEMKRREPLTFHV